MVHIVYTDNAGKKGQRELDLIMSGGKTMVIRSSVGRKVPHSRVFKGDTLYFMEKGSMAISAEASVTAVQNYVKLTEDEICKVFADNEKALALTEKQKERWHKKCICRVSLADVKAILPPLAFEKQNNMDDWLIIEKVEDVLVGTSIPYNYENARF